MPLAFFSSRRAYFPGREQLPSRLRHYYFIAAHCQLSRHEQAAEHAEYRLFRLLRRLRVDAEMQRR